MKYFEELSQAVLNEDFYETEEILIKIKMDEANPFEYIEPLFKVMETNPNIDYGMPGPVVHFMESYYKKGYEDLLLESVQRKPTNCTLEMLNSILNDNTLKHRKKYMNVLSLLRNRNDIPQNIKEDIEEFYLYQTSKN